MSNSVRQIIDTFPLATLLIDNDLSIRYVNSKGLDLLSISNFEIQNLKVHDFFPEIDTCIANESEEIKTYFLDRNGEKQSLNLKFVSYLSENSLGFIYLTSYSEPKKQLSSSSFSSRKIDFLKTKVQFFETFLNFTTDGILVFDKEGKLVYLNKIASDIFKIDQSKIRNKLIWQIPIFCSSKEEWDEKMGLLRINQQLKFDSKLDKHFSVTVRCVEVYNEEYVEIKYNDISETQKNKDLVEQKNTQIDLLNKNFAVVFYQFVVNQKQESYFTYVSENYERLFGYKIPINDFNYLENWKLHPEDIDGFMEAMKQSIYHCKSFDYIGRMILLDGKIVWIKINSNPVFQNDLVVFNGIISDITNIKDVEIENLNARKFNESILFNIPADIAVFDKNHSYLFLNPNAVSDEATRNWLIGKNDFDYCELKGIDASRAQIRRDYFNQAAISHRQVEWVDEFEKNGEDKYVLRRFYPYVVDNELVYMFGYGIDITELRKTQNIVEKNEQRNQLILKSALNAIIFTNPTGEIIFWNPKAELIFGWNFEEIRGESLFDLILPESIKEDYIKDIENYKSNHRGMIFDKVLEINVLNSLNHEFPAEISIVPIDNHIGELTFCIFLKDISSRKQKEKEIEKQNRLLQIKNKELEQFTYIASHDLQEPLLTLMSFSDLLLEEHNDSLNDEGKLFVQFINKSALRMRALVSGLMEYSRIDKNEIILDVDCNEILANVIHDLEVKINASEAKINANPLPIIKGNAIYLRLLFQNLLVNAIKFRKEKTKPEINVNFQERDTDWLFSVSDNGIGIAQKDVEQIFVIFKRLNRQDQYEGYGIGLAHCQKIVDIHKGELWVESVIDKGSNFYFTISKNL
jgi:PAS domain S-box-containing protein